MDEGHNNGGSSSFGGKVARFMATPDDDFCESI